MADLTATQLSDIRFDLADVESAFTDAELNRLWARVEALTSDAKRFEATKGLVILALLHDTAKWNSYSAGKTKEEKQQVFEHYKWLYGALYKKAVEAALGTNPAMVIGTMRAYPHQERTTPSEDVE